MEDILNKIKKGAIQVKGEAEKFTKDAVDKTKRVIDRTKYNYTISELDGRIDNILQGLGKILYDEYKSGEEFDSDIMEKCRNIDEIKKEIAEIKEKIALTKNGAICNECGEIIDEDAAFCKKCGNKVN